MKEKLVFLALALALTLPLAACTPNVPETATPTPHVTATPGGAMDDLKEAGEPEEAPGQAIAQDAAPLPMEGGGAEDRTPTQA